MKKNATKSQKATQRDLNTRIIIGRAYTGEDTESIAVILDSDKQEELTTARKFLLLMPKASSVTIPVVAKFVDAEAFLDEDDFQIYEDNNNFEAPIEHYLDKKNRKHFTAIGKDGKAFLHIGKNAKGKPYLSVSIQYDEYRMAANLEE